MTTTPAAMGRRERKKAQTRQAISDAAMKLFLQRGYDNVTVAEVAEAADTAVATVFKHFADGKPALIFDDGTERREGIVAAVRDRDPDRSALAAIGDFLLTRGPFLEKPDAEWAERTRLIMDTPALTDYSRKLWMVGEGDLAEVLADAYGRGPDDIQIRALARYLLEIPGLAGFRPDSRAALRAIVDLLDNGWSTESHSG
ncbi:TetR/AcrR family transcriptional regulator [Gordonia sp. SL306]|uniref:TetR/AcrR family transcriptional regulator n=1 Tax=Gordonia sp. SL306 TaxID=2995145 RepID=UPI00226E729F|nr:TetR/AcrR family transcriptional regulator [Gordonia sp. SL306]WAC56795.1 TetR family transcriptional regulator [Gordonia sp. SL306]